MVYKIGDRIISKKNHACGNNEWIVTRVGADVKLKCVQCGRVLFLNNDEVDKIIKVYLPAEDNQDG